MKTLPLFFALAGILLAIGTGCAASRTPALSAPVSAPQATPAKTAQQPSVAVKADAEAKADSLKPPGSEYESLVTNGALAHLVRGEPPPAEHRKAEYFCIVTGEFNIAPDGDKLLMETWCTEDKPAPGSGMSLLHPADTEAPRVPGKHVFRILFKDAVVSVAEIDGQKEVRLHYRDPVGQFHDVLLPPQQGKKYEYSFADLSPDTVKPIGVTRELRQ
ncbi:MAG: hypothetical protein V1880_04755 [Patescibacteria group bacterium]